MGGSRSRDSRGGLSTRANAATVLDGAILRNFSTTPDQVRYTNRTCRVHLILPKTRIELVRRLVLIVVDLLLSALDATQVTLSSRRFVGPTLSAATRSFLPHQPSLRELIATCSHIVRDALSLIQTMLGDKRDGSVGLLAHLDVSLTAAVHVTTCHIGVDIAVLVACHAYQRLCVCERYKTAH